jgi:two-component sensor histidine kinase
MLDLGTFTETDPKLLAVLTEAKDRIKTMALIHTNLYQHDDLSAIKFEGYLNDLLRGLADTYFNPKKKITFDLKASEDLLDIDTAVPVGLIVNELVSNAFKYAFQEKEAGVIQVEFKNENGKFHLLVKDNGCGLPEDFDPTTSKSLGLRIVMILVKQLEGELNIFRDDGTQFHITFKPLEQRKIETR